MKKIMPCLDTFDGKLVKGVKFEINKEFGNPAMYAKKYCEQGADELAVLDINATPEGRTTLLEVVKNVSEACTVPLTVGGGMRTLEEIGKVLAAGADKVSINTAAVKNPGLIKEAAEKFGSGKTVVAIDATKKDGTWKVLVNAGKTLVDVDAVEWAREAEQLGAGALLPTSLDADGTKQGYDIELTRAIKDSVSIPVIASGGAGTLEDIYNVLTEGKADIALAASIFHYGDYTVKQVKEYLKGKDVEVKL
jgi:cyclase